MSLVVWNMPPRLSIDAQQKKKKVFLSLTGVMFVAILATPVLDSVSDLINYSEYYDRIGGCDLRGILTGASGFEPGYGLLNYMAHAISKNFYFFLFVYALVIINLYHRSFYKYSPYVLFSVLMFLLTFFNQHIFLLRQGLSVAVCCYSLKYVIDRKFWYFVIACIIAFSFHNSSLVFFPVYFIYGIKTMNRASLMIILGSVVLLLFFNNILNFVGVYFERYESYLFEDRGKTSVTNVLIALIITICYVVFLGKKVLFDGINRLIFFMLIITVVSYAFSLGHTSAMVRALMCYRISYLFAIPITLRNIKDSTTRFLYGFGVLVSFFLLTYVIGDSIKDFISYKLIFL